MKSQASVWLGVVLIICTCELACQNPDYRYEVTPGQQGQTEVKRVPLTADEQAAREREKQVRAALAAPPAPPPEPDLATLESLWPKLSPANRATILDMAKGYAGEQK